MANASAPVLDFHQALALVLYHARELAPPAPPELVPILASLGRVLAQAIHADRDQPPFDRSTRDGFALRAADLAAQTPLTVIGQLRAGELWTGPILAPNEAVEIMTGAPIPPGADAVLMVEHATLTGAQLTPRRTLLLGENIVPQGHEARFGAVVVPSGTSITAAEIALAATSGLSDLAVHPRPEIAIVATGDELVSIDQTPEPWQIRNSNSYALAALVTAAGATPNLLPIARDTREDLLAHIAQARTANLILFSGGVSMGKFDLVEEVLASLGAEFLFTGVRMQPGKPVVFGRLPATPATPTQPAAPACFFFGLPGNPVSTQVTFHCFVEPLLRALTGTPAAPPRFVQATLTEDVDARPGLTRFLPAHLSSFLDQPAVHLVPWHGSGDLAANARANCYAVFPPDREHFDPGDVITVLLR